MSLLAEYTIKAELVLGEPWTITAFHNGKEIGKRSGVYTSGIEQTGAEFINAHMERVTGILEGGPIDPHKAEEADRLAHKADHDNQCEKDLE